MATVALSEDPNMAATTPEMVGVSEAMESYSVMFKFLRSIRSLTKADCSW